jgi:hypothetical protein
MALGLMGCASTVAVQAPKSAEFAAPDKAAVRISAATVVDAHVSPLVPVRVTPEREAIAVTFGQRGHTQTTRLDPVTLQVLSAETEGPAEVRQEPARSAARVVLDGGRAVVCWTEQGADGGRRAMAQLWEADGRSLGPALAISPPDADVLGAPHATSSDGRHAVVTFASTSGGAFELRAVAIEDTSKSDSTETASR